MHKCCSPMKVIIKGDAMLIKSDETREKRIIEELIEEDEKLRRQHEVFQAEMAQKDREALMCAWGRNSTKEPLYMLFPTSKA